MGQIQFVLLVFLGFFIQNAFANFPDLKLRNVRIASSITAGTPTTYTIDLVNLGEVDVIELINIAVYLSEDSQWSNKDVLLNTFVESGLSVWYPAT